MSEGLARPDALLRLTQAPGAAPPPYSSAHWISYGGGEGILLAVVLLVVAGGFAYAGKRLRTPLRVTPPGGVVTAFMIAIWLLAICNMLVATFVYRLQVKQAYPSFVVDLRIPLRSDHHDANEPAAPDLSDAVSADVLPAVVPGRVLNSVAADIAALGTGYRIRRLRSGGDVFGVCHVGRIRVCLSRGTAAVRAERHFEDPVLRSSDHAVCLADGRASLGS